MDFSQINLFLSIQRSTCHQRTVANISDNAWVQDGRAALEESDRLQRRLEGFKQSAAGRKWAQHRQNLPVWSIRQSILDSLTEQDMLVVGGDTGCGKTTQVRNLTSADC